MIKRTLLFCILLVSTILLAKSQEKFTLSGYVTDENGEALTGVYIFVPNTNNVAVSNVYGFYSLTLPKERYTIRFSFIGYLAQEFNIDLKSNQKLTISLQPESSAIEAVTVTAARKDENIKDANIGKVELQASIIKKIPNLMGEVDIIKSIQLLPGVLSSVEGTSGFYVRGGNADQNLILLDGATVYSASHLFGLFSVFNGDAVKGIELYKGGIPAEYGGRISSVLDVRMKEGNTQKIHVSGGIGLISSRLTIDGPIIKDKLSFILSARRTYADLFLAMSQDSAIKNTTMYFYDLNAKINYKINDRNRIFLSGYFGRDVNSFGDRYGMNYGNATGTLRWNHVYADKLFSNITVIYSNYRYIIGSSEESQSFKWISNIIDVSLSNDYTYYLNPSNTLKFGLQATYHTLKPGRSVSNGESFYNDILLPNNHSIESALFISNEQKISTKLMLEYGLRFSMFQNIGEGTIFHYDSQHKVFDSTVYKGGDIYNTFFSLEPRLNIRYSINEMSSLKASYNRTSQYLHLASNSTASLPFDMWFMSNPNVKPQKADQVAVGYFRNFSKNVFEVSLEVFYKKTQNAIDFRDHAILMRQKYLDGELRFGEAKSYGTEFLVRKQSGRLTGWLSYSYIRSLKLIPEINNGKEFPPSYDKPHNISIVLNYILSKKFDIGINWVYSSPMPVTVPTSAYYYGQTWLPHFSERNGTRIPGTAYHRLDLSVNFNFKMRKMNGNLNLSIYNVYNRHNAYAVFFRDKNLDYQSNGNETGVEVVKLYLYPIFPSLTFNLSL